MTTRVEIFYCPQGCVDPEAGVSVALEKSDDAEMVCPSLSDLLFELATLEARRRWQRVHVTVRAASEAYHEARRRYQNDISPLIKER